MKLPWYSRVDKWARRDQEAAKSARSWFAVAVVFVGAIISQSGLAPLTTDGYLISCILLYLLGLVTWNLFLDVIRFFSDRFLDRTTRHD